MANLLLNIADLRKLTLTQLSLLKILYFVQGWYLTTHNVSLIVQPFEAWQYGPVVKVLREEFKRFGNGHIAGRACRLDIYSGERKAVEADISPEDARFIAAIFDAYHVYDAWQLSDMTHEKDSPWDRLWNSKEPVGRLGLRIRNEDIKAHFDRISDRFQLS